ncbi:hypothetical protein AB0O91_16915 [Kitasatospora sp. NPDC089797]|uniref:hypothetical protein n=1 Tax=Kitasatospora sp. NPDC089797 TaxID=3155298 RepID=UPI0034258423
MRRRIFATVLLAAAGLFALAVPAQAATGVLVVNGVPHENPQRGCYPASRSPVSVENFTDVTVLVHAAADCRGPVTAQVEPGQSATAVGGSYFVF